MILICHDDKKCSNIESNTMLLIVVIIKFINSFLFTVHLSCMNAAAEKPRVQLEFGNSFLSRYRKKSHVHFFCVGFLIIKRQRDGRTDEWFKKGGCNGF